MSRGTIPGLTDHTINMERYSKRIQELEDVYQRHYEKFFRAAYRITGNRDDSEEVVQETFLNAYQSLSAFKQESALDTWVYRIMLNCCYKYVKKRDHLPVKDIAQREGLSEEAFWETLRSDQVIEDTVEMEDLRETCIQLFLNCIPKQQKIAFTLQVLLELPIKKVADIMEITEGAVKINVYRARQRLKENVEGRCSLINLDNPCQCSNWVKYAIDNGRMKYIPKMNPIHKRRQVELATIANELSFLAKLIRLYDNQPEYPAYHDFIGKMRRMIDQGNIKILS